jgi:hypothetical protein
MAVFVSYCPVFWGYGGIYMAHDTEYMFERHDQKLVIFTFLAIFVSYSPQFWVFGVIFKPMTLSTYLICMTKNSLFLRLWPFLWAHYLGVLGDLHGPWHLVHVWEAWPKTRHFCVLGPFSWAIDHCFGFPRWFTRPMTLMKCLRGMTKNLVIFTFLGRFVSYRPQFWVSGVIFKAHDT